MDRDSAVDPATEIGGRRAGAFPATGHKQISPPRDGCEQIGGDSPRKQKRQPGVPWLPFWFWSWKCGHATSDFLLKSFAATQANRPATTPVRTPMIGPMTSIITRGLTPLGRF